MSFHQPNPRSLPGTFVALPSLVVLFLAGTVFADQNREDSRTKQGIQIRCDETQQDACEQLMRAVAEAAKNKALEGGFGIVVLGREDEWSTIQNAEDYDFAVFLADRNNEFRVKIDLRSELVYSAWTTQGSEKFWGSLYAKISCILHETRAFIDDQQKISYKLSCTIGVTPGCTIEVSGKSDGDALNRFISRIANCNSSEFP